MSRRHFGHLERLFRNVPHLSHLDSHIVNTFCPRGSECTIPIEIITNHILGTLKTEMALVIKFLLPPRRNASGIGNYWAVSQVLQERVGLWFVFGVGAAVSWLPTQSSQKSVSCSFLCFAAFVFCGGGGEETKRLFSCCLRGSSLLLRQKNPLFKILHFFLFCFPCSKTDSCRKIVVSESFLFCLTCETTMCPIFAQLVRKNGHKIGHFSKTRFLQNNSGFRATKH